MSKRFYAVQIGREDTDCSYGSTRKREAISLARKAAKQSPGEEVRICLCTKDDDFCDGIIVIQKENHV